MTTTTEDRRRFEEWYALVDRAVVSIAGIGIDGLPDGPSWDCWSAGYSPDEYAVERLTEEGFPF